MSNLIDTLKQKKIKGVEDIRTYDGFMMSGNEMKRKICFEVKLYGFWHPLIEPEFETKKECTKLVREIKKAWRAVE